MNASLPSWHAGDRRPDGDPAKASALTKKTALEAAEQPTGPQSEGHQAITGMNTTSHSAENQDNPGDKSQ